MLVLKNVVKTLSVGFGLSATGKTVVVTVLDQDGAGTVSGFTAGSVVELGSGTYAVKITFSSVFSGYVKFNNTTDGVAVFVPFQVDDIKDDVVISRKININNWAIVANQLIIYDNDGTTALYTFNLTKEGSANGDEPDKRARV